MTVLDRIVIARAEAQLARWNYRAEPIHWDRTQIQGRWEGHGPAPVVQRARCLAGDCSSKVARCGYCRMHWQRVAAGLPVDLESYLTYRDCAPFRGW